LSVERVYHDGIFKIAAELHAKSRTLADEVGVLNEALAAKQEEIEQVRGDAQRMAVHLTVIEGKLHALEHSTIFRVSQRIRRLPILGPLLAMAVREMAGKERR
jgi:hypothetical protein